LKINWLYYYTARENELREPPIYKRISHIGLVYIMSFVNLFFKQNVIGQIVKTLETQKLKMAKSVGEELHLIFADKDDDLALEKCSRHKEMNWDW